MLSFGLGIFGKSESSALRDDLLECLQVQSRGRIRNLDLDCQGDLIVVTGGCLSPEVKQWVTRAIRAAEPHVRLQNEIRICA